MSHRNDKRFLDEQRFCVFSLEILDRKLMGKETKYYRDLGKKAAEIYMGNIYERDDDDND